MDSIKYSGEARADDPAWRVVIALGSSPLTRAWILSAGAVSLIATLAADLPGGAQAVLVCALVGAILRSLRREAFREGDDVIHRLVVDLSGRIETLRRDGAVVCGTIHDGSFVAPWLTLVRWRPDGARFCRTILVAPDATDAQAHRRLRILLRWR